MQIGNLDIGKKLIVAPMADVTNAPFRMMMKKFGAGLTFTPMFSADGVVNDNFKTLRMLSFARSENPVGVQLLGNDPKIISKAIKEIKPLKPSLIDINCGCPVAKVVGSKMGACLLSMPQTLAEIVNAMAKAAGEIPVSVKLRLGFDENRINIIENAKLAEDNGASAVIIHARTRSARYVDTVDFSWIKKVKKNVSIPVIANGSIFTPQDAVRVIDETGCDSVVVARGALGNPFIFERFNSIVEKGYDPGEPDIMLVKQTVIEHIKLIFREFGVVEGIDKAKKNIIWYFMYQNGINVLLDKIFAINEQNLLIELVEEHVSNIVKNVYEKSDKEKIRAKFQQRILFWLL